jgi:hypothetical protein
VEHRREDLQFWWEGEVRCIFPPKLEILVGGMTAGPGETPPAGGGFVAILLAEGTWDAALLAERLAPDVVLQGPSSNRKARALVAQQQAGLAQAGLAVDPPGRVPGMRSRWGSGEIS